MTLKRTLFRNLSNVPGWRTYRKLIIIESDDWGSMRMPSREIYDSLLKHNIDIETGDNKRYNQNDSLATADDLSLLFEALSSVNDATGRAAVFTPVSIMANPDFHKIKESGFTEYFYEPFTETLKRTKGCENSFALWNEGIEKRLFVPQFHAREHLNVQVWLRALQANDRDTRVAFDHGIWGYNNLNQQQIYYNAAFHLDDPSELSYHKEAIREGLQLFRNLFGYRATLFVPTNGPVHYELFKTTAENGIKYINASKIQTEHLGHGLTKKHLHWMGQKNKYGQFRITRNCFFEPSDDKKDSVNGCLNEIETAFRWKKPAVISSHRINYIGALNTANRDKGLKELKQLLTEIMKRWPEAEFLTSDDLGKLMSRE